MHSVEELRRLAGVEFSAIMAEDPELKRLDALKYDAAGERYNLFQVLGLGSFYVGRLPVQPLTLERWALLWAIASPLAVGGVLTPPELEVALYIMSEPELKAIRCDIAGLPLAASGRLAATFLPPSAAGESLKQHIAAAFAPLAMLPVANSGEPPRFDAEWVIRIAGVAARAAQERLSYVINSMPLATVTTLFVDTVRRESPHPETICRRHRADVEAEIAARIEFLGEEFLAANVKE